MVSESLVKIVGRDYIPRSVIRGSRCGLKYVRSKVRGIVRGNLLNGRQTNEKGRRYMSDDVELEISAREKVLPVRPPDRKRQL